MQGSREEVVVPIPNEGNLRMMNWVEGNRKKVDELSGGKVAYVYLPNTGGDGYNFFNRYFLLNWISKALSLMSVLMVEDQQPIILLICLSRNVINYFNKRDGEPYSTPGAVIDGPKVMITNSYAASGGDLMPFMFKAEEKWESWLARRPMECWSVLPDIRH